MSQVTCSLVIPLGASKFKGRRKSSSFFDLLFCFVDSGEHSWLPEDVFFLFLLITYYKMMGT